MQPPLWGPLGLSHSQCPSSSVPTPSGRFRDPLQARQRARSEGEDSQGLTFPFCKMGIVVDTVLLYLPHGAVVKMKWGKGWAKVGGSTLALTTSCLAECFLSGHDPMSGPQLTHRQSQLVLVGMKIYSAPTVYQALCTHDLMANIYGAFPGFQALVLSHLISCKPWGGNQRCIMSYAAISHSFCPLPAHMVNFGLLRPTCFPPTTNRFAAILAVSKSALSKIRRMKYPLFSTTPERPT